MNKIPGFHHPCRIHSRAHPEPATLHQEPANPGHPTTNRRSRCLSPAPTYPRIKDRAIAALLTSRTIVAAARKADISERTLRRWLKKDDFQSHLRRARRL